MTNALPAGTRNTSVNVIEEEYELVTATTGQAGSFYRDWALVGLEAAARAGDEAAAWLASGIKAIREERLRMKHGIIPVLITAVILQLFHGEAAKRCARRGRRDGDVICFADDFTADPFDPIGPVQWESIKEV